MRNQPIHLPNGTLTIPVSGIADVSNHIDMRKMPLRGITIFGPDTLTGTVSLEVSPNLDAELPSVVRWNNLQSGGSDIVIGADEAVPLDFICWQGLRLSSGSAEGADRVFKILGVEEI